MTVDNIKYRYIRVINESDAEEYKRKVEKVLRNFCGTLLSTSCGVVDNKVVFLAIVGIAN